MDDRLARLEDAISQIVEAVRMVCEKQAAMDEELDKLISSKVYDRLDGIESEFGSMVGGLNDIIDGRRKREYSEGFRSKHPEFGRYEDIGKRFGLDVYGLAADTTFEAPEEEREGIVGTMLEELKGKFDDLISALEKHNQHEAAESPEMEKAEQASKADSSEEMDTDEGDRVDPKIRDIAKMFRGRGVA